MMALFHRAMGAALGAFLTASLCWWSAGAAEPHTAMTSTSYLYRTEWVWLLSIYQDQLGDLAKAVSDKYRQPLEIPDGKFVLPDQWLDSKNELEITDINIDINGLFTPLPDVTIKDTVCLDAARAEFGSRKKRLDDVFASSFSRWTNIVSRHDINSVTLLYIAQADLALLGQRIDPGFVARWSRYVANLTLNKVVDAFIDALADSLPKMPVGDALVAKAKSTGADALKEAVKARFKKMILKPDKEVATDLAQQLGETADKLLLDVAYKSGGNSNPVMSQGWIPGLSEEAKKVTPGTYSPRYYELNGLATRDAGYNTSFGLEFGGLPAALSHKIDGWIWRYQYHDEKHEVRLARINYFDFEHQTTLTDIFFVPVLEGQDPAIGKVTVQADTADPTSNYAELQNTYDAYKKDLSEEMAAGEDKWFAVVTAGASNDDKLYAMAALELLVLDLQKTMAEDIPRKVKQVVLDQLTGAVAKLGAIAIGAGEIAVVKKLLKTGIAAAVAGIQDKFAPDSVQKITAVLAGTKARLAESIGITPDLTPVLPDRDGDLKKLSALNPDLPDACRPSVSTDPIAALIQETKWTAFIGAGESSIWTFRLVSPGKYQAAGDGSWGNVTGTATYDNATKTLTLQTVSQDKRTAFTYKWKVSKVEGGVLSFEIGTVAISVPASALPAGFVPPKPAEYSATLEPAP